MLNELRQKVAEVLCRCTIKGVTCDEQYRLTTHYLRPYDKYLVVPESLDISLPGCALKRFKNEYFGSVAANTNCCSLEAFYAFFRDINIF